jgi:GT2 family glycosyltransferase
MKVDIVVLNYNGENLIPVCLPSIIEAKDSSKFDVNITVIDNESNDNSLEILKKFSNRITIISHKNDFLCSFNDVVSNLEGEVVILLNNDIKVERDFIDHLVEIFLRYPNVFLVAPKVLTQEAKEEGAFTVAKIKFGLFWSSAIFKSWRDYVNTFFYTFSSGFGAFNREKFLKLGGYDRIYLPGRFEDVDLSLIAWKRGWLSYYEPNCKVYHIGLVSFKKKFF